MSEDRIQRKDLLGALRQIKSPKVWENAINRLEVLGCNIYYSTSSGKGSHGVIRDKEYPEHDIRGLISTVVKKPYKECNVSIFKQLRDFNIDEDDIWNALKIL